ncbi:acyltransferase [Lactiplantibacillus plantarum]|uniref:acyltransferase n=1 Tax=Latilactobacillus fuchuensis TaxID=164393 RepID=UPI0020C7DDF5|nr:acyltransferase [Latilactobacillus fuchuensis]MCG0826403.1 acyltransferase [Lactiplantibacillus plantarum]MCP8856899.1 acyltransferase [Latilactobacillus fuchuensis]
MMFSPLLQRRDKILVIVHVLPKLLNGLLHAPFFKARSGFQYIGRQVHITHAKHISCGRNVKFEDYAEIHGLSRKGLIFKDNVTIGRGVMIRPSSYYGKDLGEGLVIGNNSSIGPNGYVGCSGSISIGDNVMFGPRCSLFAENHVFSDESIPIKEQGVAQKGIVIENNCWIGSNVIILDGVTIGEGCVVGAGVLISKNIAPHSVVIDERNKIFRNR